MGLFRPVEVWRVIGAAVAARLVRVRMARQGFSRQSRKKKGKRKDKSMMQRMHIVISPENAELIRGWARQEDRNVSAQLGWLIKAESKRRKAILNSAEQTIENYSGGSVRQELEPI